MLVLARVLTPEDFGVVALTAIVVLLCDALATAGCSQYIIQKQQVDSHDLNTAWTIDLSLKTALWLVLEISAPLFANYFDDPRITETIRVAAFGLILVSFTNPGIILIRKNLEYNKLIKISVISKLLGFFVTVSMAIIFQSYWAMIFGNIIISVSHTIGSYFIHDFRPRLSLSRFQEQWGFSKWLLMQSILGYSRSQVDKILVAKVFSATDIGVYHVTKTLTEMPGRDIISPALEPLLSAFSKDKYNVKSLSNKVRTAFFVIMMLVIPLSIYIFFFSKTIVDTLLGEKWVAAYEIMKVLSFILIPYAAATIFSSCLLALGRSKAMFIYNVISVLLVVGFLVALTFNNMVEFAAYRTGLEFVSVFLLSVYLSIVIKVSVIRLLMLCVPSIVCAALSYYSYDYLVRYEFGYSFIELVASATYYFTIYGLLMCGSIFAMSRYVYEAKDALTILSQFFLKRHKE